MLGMRRGLPSRRIVHAAFAQDLRADAVGAQVHAGCAPALAHRGRAPRTAAAGGIGAFAAVEQHGRAFARLPGSPPRLGPAPGMAWSGRLPAGPAPTAVRARAPAPRRPAPAAFDQRQVQAAGAGREGVGSELAVGGSHAALADFSTSDSLRLRWSIRSAMVPIFRPCSRANSRSGRQPRHGAVVLHDLADHRGGRSPPCRRGRSRPSVWPARISTPPSTACSGKMWPGCTRSEGLGVAPRRPARCARGRRPRCRW